MKIRWTKDALSCLEDIHSYISKDSLRSAKKVIIEIEGTIHQLKKFPELGRIGRVKGTREMIVAGTSYIVIYRIKHNVVELLLILHSSLPYPQIFK